MYTWWSWFPVNSTSIFIQNRGYYPKGGGEVVVKVNPVKELSPINITERGNITKIYGRAFVAGVLPFKVQDKHRHEYTALFLSTFKSFRNCWLSTWIELFLLFSWRRTCPRQRYALSEKRLRTCTSTFSLCKRRTRHVAMATALCEYIWSQTHHFVLEDLLLTLRFCLCQNNRRIIHWLHICRVISWQKG